MLAANPLSSGTVLDVQKVPASSIDIDNEEDLEIEFELSWDNDWTHFPGNDLELLVTLPVYGTLPLGQTLDAPEKFVINSAVLTALLGARRPVSLPSGTWTMEVRGFEVNEVLGEGWELRVWIDGDPQ